MIEIIIALGAPLISTTGLVIIGYWQHGKLRRIQSLSEETREQVSNTHDTNLRDDMDKLAAGIKRIEHRQSKVDTKLDTVVAKHDLVAIQAQVEHARLWDAITGGDPPMPETTGTEILEVQQQKEEKS